MTRPWATGAPTAAWTSPPVWAPRCAPSPGGTVEQVCQDDLMGTTVVIDHGDGLQSAYSNLAAVPTVSVGDTVSTGSVIGSVGETALAEHNRAAHLHLEMLRDGVAVDPAQYLPQA